MGTDWKLVKELLPKGFLAIQTPAGVVVAGPINGIEVEGGMVNIEVAWVIHAKMEIESYDKESPWKSYVNQPVVLIRFPSDTPYEIDYINELQFRIIFSDLTTKMIRMLYIDYFDKNEMIDLSKIAGFKPTETLAT